MVCLGDVASHVIDVGTYCPNLCDHTWASSSAVKCVFYSYRKRSGVQIRENLNVFLHHLKLNWHRWSPSGLYVDSCSGCTGLNQES